MIFPYPTEPHERHHGPAGYRTYQSYKDWLRDDFTFRCVYCLSREMWYPDGHRSFGVDHFVPKSVDESLALNYDNLLYACGWCNSNKSDDMGLVLDPCEEPYGNHLEVDDEGNLNAKSTEGRILIDFLLLDHPEHNEYRKKIKSLVEQLERLGERDKLKEWLGFPLDLPNLPGKNPPQNHRAEGLERCYYVLREKGELPDTY